MNDYQEVILLESTLEIETLEFESTLDSAVVIGSGDLPYYDGPTVVDPRKEVQILETKNKALLDDITVKQIYRLDTQNLSGGVTVTIGLE